VAGKAKIVQVQRKSGPERKQQNKQVNKMSWVSNFRKAVVRGKKKKFERKMGPRLMGEKVRTREGSVGERNRGRNRKNRDGIYKIPDTVERLIR